MVKKNPCIMNGWTAFVEVASSRHFEAACSNFRAPGGDSADLSETEQA